VLVLSRQQDETIYIGNDVKITITGATGNVKLGIDAPPEVPIVRGELRERMEAETAKAA